MNDLPKNNPNLIDQYIKELEAARSASINLIEDLTEEIEKRIIAEKALRESEEKFRRVFEDGKFGMGLVDKSFRFLQVNEAFCRFLGYSAKELLSMTFKDITHPEHISTDVEWVKNIYEGSITYYQTEKRYITKDGKTVWGSVNINAIRDPENKFLYFLAMINDITERKKAEEELLRTTEELEHIGEMARIGGWELDVESTQVTYSKETARLHEVAFPYVPNKLSQGSEFYPPEAWPDVSAAVQAAIEHGTAYDREWPFITAKGNHIWVRAQGFAVQENGKTIKLRGTFQDITDRKQSEAKLIASEQRYSLVISASEQGIWDWNVETNEVFFSQQWKRQIGYEDHEIENKFSSWIDHLHPDEKESCQLAVQAYLNNPVEHFILEFRFRHKDGSYRFIHNKSASVRSEDGRVIRMFGTHTDITDRKLAEELVLQEKKFTQAAINSLPGLFYLFDKQGHYLRWNKNYETVSGYSAEEISGMSPLDYFTEPDKSTIKKAIQQVWTKGNVVVEGRFTSKDRTQKHYFFTGQLFWFEGKRCLIGMGIDITDLKNAEEELLKLNAVLEQRVLERTNLLARSNNLLVETGRLARVGGWEIDLKTGKNYWSEATYKIHEVEPGFEPDTNTAINFYAPESIPIISECVDRLITLGEPFDKELEFITAKKNRIWVRAIGEAYRENGKIVKIGGVFQDINDRKLIEEELKRRSAQLEASNKELEAFSYSVSHDLRAPLRAIHSFTKILRADCEGVLDEEGKRICGIIEASSVHMGQLIDDLLSFSRIGRTEIQYSKIDMAKLANTVCGELLSTEEKEKIDLKVGKLPVALGDFATIKQVMINLISNSIKYSSVKESPKIEIGCEKNNNTTVYFVKDNGVGFDMQYVHKLFGVFQRLHSNKEFEGNGVGLAIVQRIIHRHGGRVWAEGEVGKGATFYFSLPIYNEKDIKTNSWKKVPEKRQQTPEERQDDTEERQQVTEDRQKVNEERQQVTEDRQQLTEDRQQSTEYRQQVTEDRQKVTEGRQQVTDKRQKTKDKRQKTKDKRPSR